MALLRLVVVVALSAASGSAQLAIDATFVADTDLYAWAFFYLGGHQENRLPRGTDLTRGLVLTAQVPGYDVAASTTARFANTRHGSPTPRIVAWRANSASACGRGCCGVGARLQQQHRRRPLLAALRRISPWAAAAGCDGLRVAILERLLAAAPNSNARTGAHDTRLVLRAARPTAVRLRVAVSGTAAGHANPGVGSRYTGAVDVGDDGSFEVSGMATREWVVTLDAAGLPLRTRSSGLAGVGDTCGRVETECSIAIEVVPVDALVAELTAATAVQCCASGPLGGGCASVPAATPLWPNSALDATTYCPPPIAALDRAAAQGPRYARTGIEGRDGQYGWGLQARERGERSNGIENPRATRRFAGLAAHGIDSNRAHGPS